MRQRLDWTVDLTETASMLYIPGTINSLQSQRRHLQLTCGRLGVDYENLVTPWRTIITRMAIQFNKDPIESIGVTTQLLTQAKWPEKKGKDKWRMYRAAMRVAALDVIERDMIEEEKKRRKAEAEKMQEQAKNNPDFEAEVDDLLGGHDQA